MMIAYSAFRHLVLFLIAATLASCSPKPIVETATPHAIERRIQSSKAPLALVHVWATWCVPCREEFPELVEIQRRFHDRGIEFILVSADNPADSTAVEAFLKQQDSPTGSLISTELSQPFMEMLSTNWSGALPATFFYSHGRLLAEWDGKKSLEQYEQTIEKLLKP